MKKLTTLLLLVPLLTGCANLSTPQQKDYLVHQTFDTILLSLHAGYATGYLSGDDLRAIQPYVDAVSMAMQDLDTAVALGGKLTYSDALKAVNDALDKLIATKEAALRRPRHEPFPSASTKPTAAIRPADPYEWI